MASFLATARFVRGLLIFASLSTLAGAQQRSSHSQVTPRRWAEVARALGVAGEIQGDVFRVEFAPVVGRVSMRGTRLAPGAIEPPWTSFGQQAGLDWMLGRLLLPAARGAAVSGLLARAGIEVTGVVDPLPGSTPALTAVYFRGIGDSVKLARQLKKALGSLLRPPPSRNVRVRGPLNVVAIERVLGRRGSVVSGTLIFRVERPEAVKCCGLENDPLLVYSGIPLAPATGMESRIVFQSRAASAVVLGRFAVRHGEAGRVERSLAVFGIQTVGLTEPFADEHPRILFLHFFGKGKPLDLAQGIRAAIDRIRHLPPVKVP